MKYCFPEIDFVFDTEASQVNTIIIENPMLFRRLIMDVYNQVNGNEGIGVLSEEDCPVRMDKRAELIDRFVPFSLNSKSILSKIANSLEQRALDSDFFIQTTELLGRIEQYLYEISSEESADVRFERLSISALLKAGGLYVCDDYESLAENVIDYMQLVNEYLGIKVFFTVNLRSYLSDDETELFMRTVIKHGFHCIMIENCEKTKLLDEKRLLVDGELCEIR